MNTTQAQSTGSGRITQVIGPVVDVEFQGIPPEINTALLVTNPSISALADNLTVEVAQHLGEHTVRCIAMDSTDGLIRGQLVKNTGARASRWNSSMSPSTAAPAAMTTTLAGAEPSEWRESWRPCI